MRVLARLRCRPRPQALHQLLLPLQGKLLPPPSPPPPSSASFVRPRGSRAPAASSSASSEQAAVAALRPLPFSELASLAWALAELQMAPTAALLAELLEVTGRDLEDAVVVAAAAAAATASGPSLATAAAPAGVPAVTPSSLALLARSLVQLGVVPSSGGGAEGCRRLDIFQGRPSMNSGLRLFPPLRWGGRRVQRNVVWTLFRVTKYEFWPSPPPLFSVFDRLADAIPGHRRLF